MVTQETDFRRKRRQSRPLDAARLEDLALAYVARYATSAARLQAYLSRKIRERGFEGDDPGIPAIVDRFLELGYIDDAAFARTRSEGLLARGYGRKRVAEALRAAGIEEDLREELAPNEWEERQAALKLARRRRFGPFGESRDLERREKQIAAMVRAGHRFETARALVDAQDIASADEWVAQAEGME